MIKSILLTTSSAVALLGLAMAIIALILALFKRRGPDGKMGLDQGGFIAKSVFGLALTGGMALGLALTGFGLYAIVWAFQAIQPAFTPARLALVSIILGIAPLALSMFGVILARLLGGSVDARGAFDCRLAGVDLSSFVYTLFMSYWLTILTGGLAFLGLLASAVWALLN